VENKIVQQAVVTILNQIYEVDFKGFSYGFRPGRSPHRALDALAVGMERKKVNWVLDADIRGFFDNISHEWTVKFIEHRVADRRILRLIQKWLKAGVSEDGQWSETKQGTPQGAVISPLLANVYLHYVFDLWVDVWRRKVAKGDVIVVRYVDDLVLGFQLKADATRFLQEFKERLAQFTLELHPEKTRLIEFGRYAASDRKLRGERKPETFNFLASPITVGVATRPIPTLSAASRRKRAWQRSLRQSRSSFDAECMLARATSVHGFGRSSTATTNTTPFPETSVNCAPSEDASTDCGEAFWPAVVNAPAKGGSNLFPSSKDGSHTLESCILTPMHASTPLILHKSRMRKRARTDLRRGRSVMVVPTATTLRARICESCVSVTVEYTFPLGWRKMSDMNATSASRAILLIFSVCISACVLTGCVESSFTLAEESNLPKSMTLPPGLTRTDVSVVLNLSAPPTGADAKLVLTDRRGKKLTTVKGRSIRGSSSTTLQILTENGVTDTIKLKPYREHDDMEHNGRAVALFYVIDDESK